MSIYHGFIKPRLKLISISFCIGIIGGCSFFVSGNFVLDSSSKLPKWFDNKKETRKSNIRVEIDISEPVLWMPPKAEIRILNDKGELVEKRIGTWEWHKRLIENIDKGNRSPPLWININIDNTSETYEQSQRSSVLKIVSE